MLPARHVARAKDLLRHVARSKDFAAAASKAAANLKQRRRTLARLKASSESGAAMCGGVRPRFRVGYAAGFLETAH